MFHINQNGFRKERTIYNNLATLTQLISEHQNKELYVAYLDISKCYDTIEHWFIEEILNKYNFDSEFIKLISNLYKDSTTKIKTPYGYTPKIEMNRGLKQGCPLSPVMFLIIINPLLWWMEEKLQGINLYERKITSISMCDDIAIPTNNEEQLVKAFKMIEDFNLYSGLKLSIDEKDKNTKTVIASNLGKVPNVTIFQDFKNIKIPTIGQNNSYKYLGFWINLNLDWNDTIKAITESVSKNLAFLKNRCYPTSQIVEIIKKIILPALKYRTNFIELDNNTAIKIDNSISKLIYNKLNIKGFNSNFHIQKPEEMGGWYIPEMQIENTINIITTMNTLIKTKDAGTLHTITKAYYKRTGYLGMLWNKIEKAGIKMESKKFKIIEYAEITNWLPHKSLRAQLFMGESNDEIKEEIQKYKKEFNPILNLYNQDNITNSIYTNTQEIWVDGSKTNDSISLAAFYSENNLNNFSYKIKNFQYPSSYIAEVLAILLVIKSHKYTKQNIVIYSDSKAAINAIYSKEKKKTYEQIIKLIKKTVEYREIQGWKTTFNHVYSHLLDEGKVKNRTNKLNKMNERYGEDMEKVLKGNQNADILAGNSKVEVS